MKSDTIEIYLPEGGIAVCTAVTYSTKDFYFGRTLDHTFSYAEEVTVMPRKYPLSFRHGYTNANHYAMIGMACVLDDYPLYYDGMNEKGLAMAGLNFVGFAKYGSQIPCADNVAQFEVIPWVLSQCANVSEARNLLKRINITDTPFRDDLPPAQLHWLIADNKEAITLETGEEGVRIHDNPVGVLTNNPPFEMQLFQLNNYMSLSTKPPENLFSPQISLNQYSYGMGALGLPGDYSSQSRFVKAAFVKLNSRSGATEAESVSQFFHILGAVEQPLGCTELENGSYEHTVYTSCCNTDKGIYYYSTYHNRGINAVNMHKEQLDGTFLVRYPLILTDQIHLQN